MSLITRLRLHVRSVELKTDKLNISDSCFKERIVRLDNSSGSNQPSSEAGAVNESTGMMLANTFSQSKVCW
jgi:hypothetical protein